MSGIFVYSDRVELAAELVGFAQESGGPASAIVLDQESAEALKCSGAETVYWLRGNGQLPEAYAEPIVDLLVANGAEVFAVGATVRGRSLAANVAGLLDCGMASDVSEVEFTDGKLVTRRLTYGGAVVSSETVPTPGVVTVPSGMFAGVRGGGKVVPLDVDADPRLQVVGRQDVVRQGTDLASAERIVCVGMGFDKIEDLQLAADLADALQAEVGCSRGVAEEREWLPQTRYIGISGLSVKPALYLALGVSGQVQHVVGVREARTVVAVNKDASAPIFNVCDYGVVGDMYAVIPELIAALEG
ncbi:MAG: electron transfer flavoprotein subunit alpha/FixB family protein [Bifidobacteriaceae bacterium]|jgi:electron transfer flavoprotein alpha subunit|nr:electron transfer flavoprotein subunit alpha/FixB family protein [Bifidobacteriaceae bacterium]